MYNYSRMVTKDELRALALWASWIAQAARYHAYNAVYNPALVALVA